MKIERTTDTGGTNEDIKRLIDAEKNARAKINALRRQADVARKKNWGEALEFRLKAKKVERALNELIAFQGKPHSPDELRKSVERFNIKLMMID